MSDRIKELEEQAKVILEWCRQQRLPEEERDLVKMRHKPKGTWMPVNDPVWNLALYEFRLHPKPKTHTATVYWYKYFNGAVSSHLSPVFVTGNTKFIGTSTVEFTEPQE